MNIEKTLNNIATRTGIDLETIKKDYYELSPGTDENTQRIALAKLDGKYKSKGVTYTGTLIGRGQIREDKYKTKSIREFKADPVKAIESGLIVLRKKDGVQLYDGNNVELFDIIDKRKHIDFRGKIPNKNFDQILKETQTRDALFLLENGDRKVIATAELQGDHVLTPPEILTSYKFSCGGTPDKKLYINNRTSFEPTSDTVTIEGIEETVVGLDSITKIDLDQCIDEARKNRDANVYGKLYLLYQSISRNSKNASQILLTTPSGEKHSGWIDPSIDIDDTRKYNLLIVTPYITKTRYDFELKTKVPGEGLGLNIAAVI